MLKAASSSARSIALMELSPFSSFVVIFLDGKFSFRVGFACSVGYPGLLAEDRAFYTCTINIINCVRSTANRRI
jgi:hypothetical protein